MEHLLAGLNRAQHEAVTATEGYVRVIAGAGSGKTRALSHRFAYLVNELGILPGNILCVTFTNKSANEMRQRIHALTGDNDTGYINTFHGFCVSVLQEDSHAVQYPKSFLVLDNSDIDAMLGIIYEERGLTLRDMTYSAARDMIEIRKLFKEPEYYKDMITMSLDTLREKYERADTAGDIIFYGYLYQEKKCFGLDYNDLIKFSLYIFEQHEDIRLKWQQRLEYIMTLAAANTLGMQVSLPAAILLSIMSALGACGASGVAGGSLLLIPMACSLFGISNDIAMQVVGVGFIIGVIQDSVETALNSAGDVEFAATAEYHQWLKQGKPLPEFLGGKKK